MFSICATFDSAYFKYGYPLCCSIRTHYPTNILVLGVNLSSKQRKNLLTIPDLKLVDKQIGKMRDEDYHMLCFNNKAEVSKIALATFKTDVALIDADCLFLGSIKPFEDVFAKYDLGVHTRWTPQHSREWTNFCSHNVFLRNCDTIKTMVDNWIACLPTWVQKAAKYKVNRAYSEQACLWSVYERDRSQIRLLDTKDANLPLLHAKGAKYPSHAGYSEMQYEQKCNDAIAAFERLK